MMAIDDDQSEAVDWGDGDEGPEETAESVTAGMDADAVSLASDDDDLEALKKYHQNAWDDSHEPPASDQASQDVADSAPAPAPTKQEHHEAQDNHSTKDGAPNVHGLPPKPTSTAAYSKGTPSTLVSTSATSMAQRDARVNGSRNSPEPRDANRPALPPGWEIRTSRKSEVYYYHDVAGKAQWEVPTEPIHPTRSTSSRERSKKAERNGARRSRSRERRNTRRSMSPPRATYRPRSRSIDRDTHYRPPRHVSPKREIPRASREVNAPRVRSRPSSRERRASPKPSRAVERRSRSPPRVRETRDGPRQESHQELLQHQSSRHRSPPAKARSQERDNYRPPRTTKVDLDIDHREQVVHGTVRRRRSWGSPGPNDSKRRRVVSPPPAKGVDRYVPDRSSRMELDPPTSRQETKRTTASDSNDRPRESHQSLPQPPSREKREERHHRETQQSLPQPPPRERRDRADGDQYRPTASQGQRMSPQENLKTIESSAVIPRSRVPLPPQSEAMRSGNFRKPPRGVPMDVDMMDNFNPDPTSTAHKGVRPRGQGRTRSPPRHYEDGGSRSKGDFLAPSSGYDQPPKVDRTLHREIAAQMDSRNGMPPRHPFSSDGHGGSQRGRGSRVGPLSTSNMIPLANPKEFGRPSGTGQKEEALETPSEQPSTSNPNGINESKQNPDGNQKRPRNTRFGPPTTGTKPQEATVVQESRNTERPGAMDGKQETAAAAPVVTSIIDMVHEHREAVEEFHRDPPPHLPNSEQDVRRLQYARREDGLRIDRHRTSKAETEKSGDASEAVIDAVIAKGDARPPQEPGGHEVPNEPVPTSNAVETMIGDSSRNDSSDLRSPTMPAGIEGSKPASGHQGSLLDRLAPPTRSFVEPEGDGIGMEGDEGGAPGTTDRARKPRGRRPNRGSRR